MEASERHKVEQRFFNRLDDVKRVHYHHFYIPGAQIGSENKADLRSEYEKKRDMRIIMDPFDGDNANTGIKTKRKRRRRRSTKPRIRA